ncbi:type II toxin-antitoxin system RelE/ParE family toxin [Sediminicola luteus]|uniref:Toxin n=1 Tax=Sediminicola luteus TaxID=319238 RepID=A0A2A4GCZ7_9FLAO|nr:type II toxin-antitoxin system RelE/ParE family toxin [Sediminicola luteus]PCE66487.1 hypothetical protein B7P33_04105 [Sediminicola luteus]
MDNYILSIAAERDIDAIFSYSESQFGTKQAITYLKGLQGTFEKLSEQPTLGQKRDEVKEGLYSYSFKSHIVFFRMLPQFIRIVRVLHYRRDLPKLDFD